MLQDPTEHSQERQDDDSAHGGGDEGADEPVRAQLEEPENETADERSDDPDSEVADQNEPVAPRDLASKPPGDDADDQEPERYIRPLSWGIEGDSSPSSRPVPVV